mgnify:CR=1 FL=1
MIRGQKPQSPNLVALQGGNSKGKVRGVIVDAGLPSPPALLTAPFAGLAFFPAFFFAGARFLGGRPVGASPASAAACASDVA